MFTYRSTKEETGILGVQSPCPLSPKCRELSSLASWAVAGRRILRPNTPPPCSLPPPPLSLGRGSSMGPRCPSVKTVFGRCPSTARWPGSWSRVQIWSPSRSWCTREGDSLPDNDCPLPGGSSEPGQRAAGPEDSKGGHSRAPVTCTQAPGPLRAAPAHLVLKE